jgi:thioredoxin-like negative regulator of GroEL
MPTPWPELQPLAVATGAVLGGFVTYWFVLRDRATKLLAQARRLAEQQDWAGAAAIFEAALQERHDLHEARLAFADALEHLDKPGAAESQLRAYLKARQRDPRWEEVNQRANRLSAQSHLKLGSSLLLLQKAQQASFHLKRAVELDAGGPFGRQARALLERK